MKRVKKYQHGFVLDPFVLSPNNTVADVLDCKKKFGFCGIPITENGKMGGESVVLASGRVCAELACLRFFSGNITVQFDAKT